MPTTFSYPYMPMYVHDQATYMRQMHDWHNQMAHFHEQNRFTSFVNGEAFSSDDGRSCGR
jgi:hypothetical protein